jgi:hypothetical protein
LPEAVPDDKSEGDSTSAASATSPASAEPAAPPSAPESDEQPPPESDEQPKPDGAAPTSTATPLPQEQDPSAVPPQETEPAEQEPADTASSAQLTEPKNDGSEESASVPQQPESDKEAPEAAADDTPPAGTESDVKPAVGRYQPLEDVASEIRKRLAIPRAQERLDEIIAKTQQRLVPYLQWHQTHRDDETGTPPEVPLAEISSEPPLEIGSIPLSDEFEIQEYDLGKSMDSIVNEASPRWIPFVQVGFERGLETFQARLFPAQRYLWPKFIFWMTRSEPAYEPVLDEIRNEVVVAWKRTKALDLAVAEAEAAAIKAREAGKPLPEASAESGRTFIGPVDVRWMTTGSLPQGAGALPQPTEIPGVEGTTEDMLRSIFRMEPGEVTVMTNAAKSIVYVVRAVSSSPTPDILHDRFLHGSGVAQELQGMRLRELMNEWRSTYFDILQQEQVEWQREPANPTR